MEWRAARWNEERARWNGGHARWNGGRAGWNGGRTRWTGGRARWNRWGVLDTLGDILVTFDLFHQFVPLKNI